MNPELLRTIIAEFCGWRKYEGPPFVFYWYHEHYSKFPQGATPEYELPDFPNDLNACAEMEKTLTTLAQRSDYQTALTEICANDMEFSRYGRPAIFATPLQRCEAFLRTLNLWPA